MEIFWSVIALLSFIGIFVTFVISVVQLFRKKTSVKKAFLLPGLCLLLFVVSVANVSKGKEDVSTQPKVDKKSPEELKKEQMEKAAREAAEKKKSIEEAKKKKAEELKQPSKFAGISKGQLAIIQSNSKHAIELENKSTGKYSKWNVQNTANGIEVHTTFTTKIRSSKWNKVYTLILNKSNQIVSKKHTATFVLETGQESYLKVISMDAVKNNLKVPSTAKFDDGFFAGDSWVYRASEKDTSDRTMTRYYVSSYVDAQNSFAAMIRSNFRVTVEVN